MKDTATTTITPASLIITAANSSKVYDGTTTVTGATPIVSGLQGSDKVTGYSEDFISRNAGSGVTEVIGGSNFAIQDGNGGNNYTLSTVDGVGSISKDNITITTAAANSLTYGSRSLAQANITATITAGIPDGNPDGLSAEAVILNPVDSGASRMAVGTYDIAGYLDATLFGVSNWPSLSNYNVTNDDGTLTITPAQVTGSFTAANETYNGLTAATVTGTSLITLPGDDVQLTYAGATFASANAGTQTVTLNGASLTGSDASNYSLATPITTTANITKADLTVVALNMSQIYNGSTVGSFPWAIEGNVFGSDKLATVANGTPGFTGTAVGAANAGSYTITPTLGTLTATNYDFTTFVNSTLTITKANATVNVTPYNVTYNGIGHNATTPLVPPV